MHEAVLPVTDLYCPRGRERAAHGAVFTSAGFLRVMARSRTAGTAASQLVPKNKLAPETLDEHPDAATAWVTGFYALALMRRPDPFGLEQHASALRSGASPASVLDAIMASPEALTAGITRPDLPNAYVTGAYLVGLGRLPEPQGLALHVSALEAGLSERELLERLLASEEARAQLRFPPAPVRTVDLLAEHVQTVGLRVPATPEQTAWAGEALRSGASPRQVIRSLARRVHGVSRAGIVAALTARWRAARSCRAASTETVRAEILRERAWQWKVQRRTWERLDRLEAQVTELARSTADVDQQTT